MRTPLLAATLSLSILGCVDMGDTGTPPTNTGSNGTNSNGSNNGPGSSNGSNSGGDESPGPTLNPHIEATLDRETITTELGKKEIITLKLTSVDGFAGAVTVAPSALDTAGAALAGGITVAGDGSVTLAANGTASAMYAVTIPTNASGTQLSGTVQLAVTSPAGTKQLTAELTVAPVLTITYAAGLGSSVATHPVTKQVLSVKKGATIQVHNADTAVHITHGQGVFPHETTGANGGLPNNTYTLDTSNLAAGSKGVIGCHSHGSGTYANVTVE